MAIFFIICNFASSLKDWCHRTLQSFLRFSHRIPCLSCWKTLLLFSKQKNSPEDSLEDWLRKNKNHRSYLKLIFFDELFPLINALYDFGKVHCQHFFWLILKIGWSQLLFFYILLLLLPMIYRHRLRRYPE